MAARGFDFSKKGRPVNPRTTQRVITPLVTRTYEALGQPKKLEQLGKRDCRWPCNDPQDPDFHFCGARTEAGKVFCAAHTAIAYSKTFSSKDDE